MCVFTDKTYKKYVALVLVPVIAINTYVGYTMVLKSNNDDVEYEDVPGIEEVVTESLGEEFQVSENVGNQELSNNEFTQLVNEFNSSNMSVEEILSTVNKGDSLYASALYTKLKNYFLTDDVILQELENVVCFGTQATCVSEDMWNNLFGNLLGTISEYDNVIDYYYPLALYIHLHSCELEHDKVFFDETRVTCTNLENLLNEKVPSFDYKSYIIEMVETSDSDILKVQLNTILNSGVDFDDAINELEYVYQFSMVPTDLSEELWNMLFGTLMKTIDENSNVCSEYYDLAYYVHSLWCDFEHNMNEYERYECNTTSLILEK